MRKRMMRRRMLMKKTKSLQVIAFLPGRFAKEKRTDPMFIVQTLSPLDFDWRVKTELMNYEVHVKQMI